MNVCLWFGMFTLLDFRQTQTNEQIWIDERFFIFACMSVFRLFRVFDCMNLRGCDLKSVKGLQREGERECSIPVKQFHIFVFI